MKYCMNRKYLTSKPFVIMGLFTRKWEKNEDGLKVLENVTKVLFVLVLKAIFLE